MNRREWLKRFGGGGGVFWLSAPPAIIGCQKKSEIVQVARQTASAKIAFINTRNRAEGIGRALDLLNLKDKFKNKSLFIKPNFNSADETPGSTHKDALEALLTRFRKMEAGAMTIGDRSGMGDTRAVMEAKDTFKLAWDFKARTQVFDELKQEDWQFFNFKNSLWQKGFALPKQVLANDAIVQTCCLKTHRYGGHFTLSLKNSVGLAAKRVPGGGDYNFMTELHSSPNQRRMIAEINAAYRPALIVLDGVEAFTTGGPDKGTRVDSEVILAGDDRVAIDAVGVAILRSFGTTPEVERGKIFEQEQIAQAVKLGVGVGGADQIEFLTDDRASAEYAQKIRVLLA